nr:hypothetical protein Iba_chr07eCG3080 [Ipomoea batatas]
MLRLMENLLGVLLLVSLERQFLKQQRTLELCAQGRKVLERVVSLYITKEAYSTELSPAS